MKGWMRKKETAEAPPLRCCVSEAFRISVGRRQVRSTWGASCQVLEATDKLRGRLSINAHVSMYRAPCAYLRTCSRYSNAKVEVSFK